jgi:hypothetical protein
MYNKFYGFSEEPFPSIPTPNFVPIPSHYEALSSVMSGIKERKG